MHKEELYYAKLRALKQLRIYYEETGDIGQIAIKVKIKKGQYKSHLVEYNPKKDALKTIY